MEVNNNNNPILSAVQESQFHFDLLFIVALFLFLVTSCLLLLLFFRPFFFLIFHQQFFSTIKLRLQIKTTALTNIISSKETIKLLDFCKMRGVQGLFVVCFWCVLNQGSLLESIICFSKETRTGTINRLGRNDTG